jgi:hypothetical protein
LSPMKSGALLVFTNGRRWVGIDLPIVRALCGVESGRMEEWKVEEWREGERNG